MLIARAPKNGEADRWSLGAPGSEGGRKLIELGRNVGNANQDQISFSRPGDGLNYLGVNDRVVPPYRGEVYRILHGGISGKKCAKPRLQVGGEHRHFQTLLD